MLCDKFAADVILGFCERRGRPNLNQFDRAPYPLGVRHKEPLSLGPKLEMRLIHAIKSVMALEIIHSLFGAPSRSRHKNDAIDRRCNWWLEIGQVLHWKSDRSKLWQDGRRRWAWTFVNLVHLRLLQKKRAELKEGQTIVKFHSDEIVRQIYPSSCTILKHS